MNRRYPANSSPFRWDQCDHGKSMHEFCRECRIVWLADGIEQRERAIERDRAELAALKAQQ